MHSKKYHGVIPPIITPVDTNENIDEQGFRSLIEYSINGGLHGLFVAGTNGETMALTQTERNRAIKIALDQANGRIPIMAGVMDTSTRRVIENIKCLEDMGGTCAVVTSIFYDRHTSQDETVRHVEQILKETSVDIVIYNIPPFTGLKLSAPTVLKIAKLDKRVVGYKDSSGAYGDFIQILAAYKDNPDFSVLQGATPLALTSVLMGADGFVPSLAPAFPELFSSAYDAARSKNPELTWKYNELIRESSKMLGMTKNATAAAKYAISLRGFTDKRVIMPQDIINSDEEAQIRKKFAEIDDMYAALKASLA